MDQQFSEDQVQMLIDIGQWGTGAYIVLTGIENMVAQGKIIVEDADTFLKNLRDVIESAPEATKVAGFYSYISIINKKKD